jgi:hypothetical protein
LDQVVDEVLTVASVTSLDEVKELALVETTVGIGKLEWPQKIVGKLELVADRVSLSLPSRRKGKKIFSVI